MFFLAAAAIEPGAPRPEGRCLGAEIASWVAEGVLRGASADPIGFL